MKKIYLFLCLTALCFTAIAQSKSQPQPLKPFKVDVSFGYAIPAGTGAKGGVLFAVEPKYAVIPNLSLGVRFEGAVMARFGGYDQDGTPAETDVKGSGSYLATGDYYLMHSYAFRPFVGAGAGIFTLAGAEVKTTSGNVSAGAKFGGMIRAGVEVSHFRAGIEYNLIPKTTYTGYDSNGNVTEGLTTPNSYIGIKVGVCFGGGRLKK